MNDPERKIFAAMSALILAQAEQLEHAVADAADLEARLADVLGTGPEVEEAGEWVESDRCDFHRDSTTGPRCRLSKGHTWPHEYI